jgi:polyhydroxyalkanoate synthesis regulator phasin
MPSVDELLNAAEVAEVTLTETNDKIEIDADTRTMITPDTERIFGVMSDEKGERKYFRCKRFVGNGIDLSKLSLRIVFQNASGLDTGRDKYIVTDLATDGEDYVTFSWELSRKVTAYKGIISFIVCAIKTNSDGTITNEWNTTLANGIVLEGLEANGTQEQEEVARDYYNQLEAELLKLANEQKAEIEKKAQEALKTIPSDYTQMQKDVNGLKEDIGDLKNILDEFPINFTRGYHVTYVSNGVTKVKESSDTASSAYQQRVKSPSYDKGVIPVGSSVICKGLATARVWFVTYENTLIGYTEFVKEYTIPETYNGSSYDRIYIDAKNNDSSVMEMNYAKKNIRVVGEKNIQDRLANVEEEAEKAIKYITPSKKKMLDNPQSRRHVCVGKWG